MLRERVRAGPHLPLRRGESLLSAAQLRAFADLRAAQVHAILSEVLQGGLVLETSLPAICAAASASAKARKKSAAAGSVAAALPGLADWVAPAGAAAGAWGEGWRRELGRFTGR